jgi:hypothetical protein
MEIEGIEDGRETLEVESMRIGETIGFHLESEFFC